MPATESGRSAISATPKAPKQMRKHEKFSSIYCYITQNSATIKQLAVLNEICCTWSPLNHFQTVVVVTFFDKTFTIAKQHWHISIKEHITGLGAITFKKMINLR